jgi:hypothetical protein
MLTPVCFAYAPEALKPDTRLPDRPELFAKLLARDLLGVVSIGAEAAFSGNELTIHTLDDADTLSSGSAFYNVDEVGVLVNRIDRSIKVDTLADTVQLPPMINENAMRRLAWHKERVAEEVLDPLHIGIATIAVESLTDATLFVDQTAADTFMVKSRHGALGEGMQVIDRDQVVPYFADNNDLYSKRVLQPAYDFSLPLPASLKPFDAASGEAFAGWGQSDKTKELRMYGFLSPESTAVYPAARVRHEGDQWFFVDPESIPSQLMTKTQLAMQRAAMITGSRSIYGSVDYGYGSLDGQEPAWVAIELNGLAPYMIGYDKHRTVADKLRSLFADQIKATVDFRIRNDTTKTSS